MSNVFGLIFLSRVINIYIIPSTCPSNHQHRCGMILSTLLNLLLILILKIFLLQVISMQSYSVLIMSLLFWNLANFWYDSKHIWTHSFRRTLIFPSSNSSVFSRTFVGECFLGQYLSWTNVWTTQPNNLSFYYFPTRYLAITIYLECSLSRS